MKKRKYWWVKNSFFRKKPRNYQSEKIWEKIVKSDWCGQISFEVMRTRGSDSRDDLKVKVESNEKSEGEFEKGFVNIVDIIISLKKKTIFV